MTFFQPFLTPLSQIDLPPHKECLSEKKQISILRCAINKEFAFLGIIIAFTHSTEGKGYRGFQLHLIRRNIFQVVNVTITELEVTNCLTTLW